jgi:HAD superfamily hydrolase (TIGR01509 family)
MSENSALPAAPGAVIFDMDGVIVASGRIHAESWKLLARRHGRNITDEQFKASFGQTSREIIRTWWGPELSDVDVHTLDLEKEALYRHLITGVVPLTIGVRETLWGLERAGYRMAIATSGPLANVELVLREGGMEGFFAALATGEDVTRGKPAPDVFLIAAERLGVPPARCVVVEDAPVGIEAGIAAGMKVIGFVGTHPAERLKEAGAHLVARHMNEITPSAVAALLKA